jgi:hypothetical protein
MPSKYVMKVYSKRHSISPGITNYQTLRECESGCAVVYCANLTQPNNVTLVNPTKLPPTRAVTLGCAMDYCTNLT